MAAKRILLGVTGGIAAYKSAELVRLLKKSGHEVRVVMTRGAEAFVTPLTFQALSGEPVRTSLLDPEAESGMGHIELAKWADQVVIAPASADFIARLAQGMADDLLTTLCCATEAPIAVAPAMNQAMWGNRRTQRNIELLAADAQVTLLGPDQGAQACGDVGPGRMLEPTVLFDLISGATKGPLAGRRVVITAGPTREPIDPVRYIANRSSGRQGFAIAQAAAEAGAQVTLVAGPVHLPTPAGVMRVDVETALEMEGAVHDALPADVAVMVAAVADWRSDTKAEQKIKKNGDAPAPLALTENPDILAGLAKQEQRPGLLIGFAAETEKIAEHAQAKLLKKGCDWIVANDVSGDVMGGADNSVYIVTAAGSEIWERMPKSDVARKLVQKISEEI